MKILKLKQNTFQWLAERRNTANASETPALFGVSPWTPKNELELAHLKWGELAIYENPAIAGGLKQEPKIRQWAEREFNTSFAPIVIEHDNLPWFRASLDGYSAEKQIIIEIKNSAKTYQELAEDGIIAYNYYLQVQHQLAVAGLDVCYFIVRHSETGDIIYKEIRKDEVAQAVIIKKWEKFFEKYEWGKRLPPLKEEKVDFSALALAEKYKEIDKKIKELQQEQNKIKEQLLKFASDNKKTLIGSVEIIPTERKSTDYKGLIKGFKIDDKELKKYEKVSKTYRIIIKKEGSDE